MGWADELLNFTVRVESRMKGSEPRPMTDGEFDSLHSQPQWGKQTTSAEIRKKIQMRNPVRWRRLQSELRWAQKQMRKMGYNPEDLRYIL